MNASISGVTTWLEIALAPHMQQDGARVLKHHAEAREDGSQWFALSVNGRLLHAGGGGLTLLKGHATVSRFLHLIGLSGCRDGEPLAQDTLPLDSACRLCISEDESHPAFGQVALENE